MFGSPAFVNLARQMWDKHTDIPWWPSKVEPSVSRASVVSLREIAAENLIDVLKMYDDEVELTLEFPQA